MYVKVYAPSGEDFEVSEDRAAELILQKGWTRSKTSDAPASVPARAAPAPRLRTVGRTDSGSADAPATTD